VGPTAEPFFLGSRLAAYQLACSLSDLGLAGELGCSLEDLTMLRLCRAPRQGVAGVADVRVPAERFGCDAGSWPSCWG
jgi:hypothetical protein